jgi:hypothetical protein
MFRRIFCRTLIGGGPTDVDATVFTYPTNGLGESAVGVVKGKTLVPDASGHMFGHPAHSGNFAAHFEAGLVHSFQASLRRRWGVP